MVFSASKGFTLIEILVVVVIMGLTVGGGIAAYNKLNDRQMVLQGAKNVVSQLRLAQKRADAGEKPFSSCLQLDGYRVAGSGQLLTMGAVCDGDLTQIEPTNFQLTGNAYFATPFAFTFQTLSAGVTGATNVVVIDSSQTISYTIVVTPAGAVTIQGE